jgi:DNA mismatch endonuclease (patch repair protein)
MADTFGKCERSRIMALVRSKDTGPEMLLRRLVHSLGYRYRLHDRRLPGVPDLVFRSRRRVIFVHGCFWHQHSCARGNRMPKSRIGYWRNKLEGNVARDRRAVRALRRAGWRVLTVWECQMRDLDKLRRRITSFLSEAK